MLKDKALKFDIATLFIFWQVQFSPFFFVFKNLVFPKYNNFYSNIFLKITYSIPPDVSK